MQCQDAMVMLVYTCREQDSVTSCARLMREEKIGFVPVVDERGEVVGVVTDRDLALRVLADARPPTTRVWEVMSPGPFVTCRTEDDLAAVEERMASEHKGRALVLDQAGRLAGVLSLSDVVGVEGAAARSGKLLREVTRRESVAITRP